MQPQLPLAEYVFTYQAIDEIKIPPFPGKLFHGAFGNALYKNACVAQGVECSACMFKKQCAYTNLFKRQYFSSVGSIRNLSATPSPHIFRYQNQSFNRITRKHAFSIGMIVVGKANQYIKDVSEAMDSLGALGLSQKRAKLISIEQCPDHGLPVQMTSMRRLPKPEQPLLIAQPKKVNIRFLTPYIPTGKAYGKDFAIEHWLMGLIRRISLLQNIYTDNTVFADFKYLKQLTKKVEIERPHLYWYKTPHSCSDHTSGFLGGFDLNLNGLEDLWPWLYLGQWTHSGKKTSYGKGRYEIFSIE